MKKERSPRVGVAVPFDDMIKDLHGNNEALTARVVARLKQLRRISDRDRIRILDWTLYRNPPEGKALEGTEVWLSVKFEVLGKGSS